MNLVGFGDARKAAGAVPWAPFPSEVIVLCVRWYLRYPLSYRNLEEMMAERGLSVDHSTIARWVLHYSPILAQSIVAGG